MPNIDAAAAAHIAEVRQNRRTMHAAIAWQLRHTPVRRLHAAWDIAMPEYWTPPTRLSAQRLQYFLQAGRLSLAIHQANEPLRKMREAMLEEQRVLLPGGTVIH